MPYIVFKIPTGYYLYDRKENDVIEISRKDYNEFISDETEKVISKYQSKGLCLVEENFEIKSPFTNSAKFLIDNEIENVVMQVTQNCNLRCSYCAYSGIYQNRRHSNKRMTLEMAKRVIDFTLLHASGVKTLTTGFYGGEPLLEFELIKGVVEYVKLNYPQKHVEYNLTTNATLLSQDILHFFEENEFRAMISLDGNKDVHDRERKFINGNGTHDIVMENLRDIKENFTKVYNGITTNTVVVPSSEYKDIINFLDNNETIAGVFSSIGMVSDVGISKEVTFNNKTYEYIMELETKILLFMCGRLYQEYTSNTFMRYKSELEIFYKRFKSTPHSKNTDHPSGPCVPGVRRLFADVDGNLYPCEKVVEKPFAVIGTIESGFDEQKINEMMNIAKITEKECSECWAFYFCDICIASLADDGNFRQEKLKRCHTTKMSAIEKLSNIVLLQDLGYEFDLNKI